MTKPSCTNSRKFSCTNESQTSSEKPQIHVYKTRNTPGVYVYACTKAKNKMHLGETDMFLVQIIKRKISVIISAKPMHLSIQETTLITIMVTFSIGQFCTMRKQSTFPEAALLVCLTYVVDIPYLKERKEQISFHHTVMAALQ